MRSLKIFLCTILLVLLVVHTVSMAQERPAQTATSYVPRLSDLMVVIQVRHSKLFYAVKRGNWPLAAFELEQLYSSLKEAARFYPQTLPASELTDTDDKITSAISEAIKAKDEDQFDRSFAQMTAKCNQCHEADDRAFIIIRRPSFPSAFSNQLYGPRPSEGKK